MAAPGSKKETEREKQAATTDSLSSFRKFFAQLAWVFVLLADMAVVWAKTAGLVAVVALLLLSFTPLTIAAVVVILVILTQSTDWVKAEASKSFRRTFQAIFRYRWRNSHIDDRSIPTLLKVEFGEVLGVKDWWTLTRRERWPVSLFDSVRLEVRRRWTDGKNATQETDGWRKDVADQQRRRFHFSHHDSGRDEFDENVDWIELTQHGPNEEVRLKPVSDVDWTDEDLDWVGRAS